MARTGPRDSWLTVLFAAWQKRRGVLGSLNYEQVTHFNFSDCVKI